MTTIETSSQKTAVQRPEIPEEPFQATMVDDPFKADDEPEGGTDDAKGPGTVPAVQFPVGTAFETERIAS